MYDYPINNTVVEQILYNHPYEDYVCYRQDNNTYIVVCGDISLHNNYYSFDDVTIYTYTASSYNTDPDITVSTSTSGSVSKDDFVYSSFNDGSLKLRSSYEENISFILYLGVFLAFTWLLFDKCICRSTTLWSKHNDK